jgi:thioredoxin 1
MGLEVTDGNITEIMTQNEITVLDFWAEWCGPCRMLGPIIDELSSSIDYATIGKVNVDVNPVLAKTYGVRSIPTIIFFKNGEVAGKLIGVSSKAAILSKIDELKS